ncbi:hypothetical protein A3B85_02190 [Candidatus Nomurabacteria bacterium RIFCSPHIGHO2_02_FULL_37_13]|uniref:EF-hand domain-containing protein n=1 Tax=Candidatus Nomurabacteria bacterium RIFCSPHIGHO2_02_FULL_37_13 TaxID=1801750 RepID=A0A1F6W5P2_9BACT|nr:MAG: hypothetical protein A3B85_02190 [Candidatus Nomurabacteria bacterium RIFCSPHIGHO2_02_FULL_37_13]
MVFVVVLFFLKTKTIFKNEEKYISQQINQAGLIYSNEVISKLVNKDTDGDGMLDWEEGLWGTDPTKKDTNGDGVLDNIEIEKLKSETGQGEQGESLLALQDENLTETDKFSRELFATVATFNQSGAMDQVTVDKISDSLAEQIKNTPSKKIFLISDIKVIADDTVVTIQKYSNTLDGILSKITVKYTVIDVLQKFVGDENNENIEALSELDPIIKQTTDFINGMVKMETPQSLATLHLDVVNALERLIKNLNDIKLYDSDIIVALGAISQYQTNTIALESATQKLTAVINQKLNN